MWGFSVTIPKKTQMKTSIKDHGKELEKKFALLSLKILTGLDVYNMMVGAWEGGSSYWCEITEQSEDAVIAATPEMKDEPFIERVLMAVLNGLEISFTDKEEDKVVGPLNKDSWTKAEHIMIAKYRRHLGDVLAGNDDATTADVFFQCAVLGDCIYG